MTMKDFGCYLATEVKLFSFFLKEHVQKKVRETYGDECFVAQDKIYRTFQTYPYPKEAGYWFIKDNDLFVVMHD
jgi:hypothetical protein